MAKNRLFGGYTPKTLFLGLFGPPGPPRGRGFTSTPSGAPGVAGRALRGLLEPSGPREGVWDPVPGSRDRGPRGPREPPEGLGGRSPGSPGSREGPAYGVLHQPLAPGPRGTGQGSRGPGVPGSPQGPPRRSRTRPARPGRETPFSGPRGTAGGLTPARRGRPIGRGAEPQKGPEEGRSRPSGPDPGFV